jgi:hypothetical protein
MSTPTRAQFAAALTASGVVTGSAYRPVPTGEGAAWAQAGPWDNTDLPPGTFIAEWLIYVIPPQDEVAASMWWDTTMPIVVGALVDSNLVSVDRVEPVALVAESGQLYAILITARSE